jgi:hypothetical protein
MRISPQVSTKFANSPSYRTRLSLLGLEDRVTPSTVLESGPAICTVDPSLMPVATTSVVTPKAALALQAETSTQTALSAQSNPAALTMPGGSYPHMVLPVGSGPGKSPEVRIYDAFTTELKKSFLAYDPNFIGGIQVVTGDINNDDIPEIITGVRRNGASHIKAFDLVSGAEIRSFYAFGTGYTGGVSIASADINGDGADDIIVGAAGQGAPHVKVFSGSNGEVLKSFYAYSSNMSAGIRVAAGEVNGDGKADIITAPGAGASSHVKVFDGNSNAVLNEFYAYDPQYTGGVSLATYDRDAEIGKVEIYTGADSGNDPHIKRFHALTEETLESFYLEPDVIPGSTAASGESLSSQMLNNFSIVPTLLVRIAW